MILIKFFDKGNFSCKKLTKNVIKAHGSSNRNHISGAVKIALDLVQHDMLTQVSQDIQEANEILRPEPLTNR